MSNIQDLLDTYISEQSTIKNCAEMINQEKNLFIAYTKKVMMNSINPLYVEERVGYSRYVMHRSDEYEIIVIRWSPGCATSIHDHAKRGCLMLVCDGELKEVRYDLTTLEVIQSTKLDDSMSASYIDNSIAYHQIANVSDVTAHSIHIYSPPCHSAKLIRIE